MILKKLDSLATFFLRNFYVVSLLTGASYEQSVQFKLFVQYNY